MQLLGVISLDFLKIKVSINVVERELDTIEIPLC